MLHLWTVFSMNASPIWGWAWFDPHGATITAAAVEQHLHFSTILLWRRLCLCLFLCCIFCYKSRINAPWHKRSGAAGALRLAGMCTPTVCHMHVHTCAHLLAACRYTGSIGWFLCRNDLFLDRGGLFLLAGLQPLSAAHGLELLWKDPKWLLAHLLWFLSELFLWLKIERGGFLTYSMWSVFHSLLPLPPTGVTTRGFPSPSQAARRRQPPWNESTLLTGRCFSSPPHSELYQFPFIFFYHHSKSMDHNRNTLLSCTWCGVGVSKMRRLSDIVASVWSSAPCGYERAHNCVYLLCLL